MRNLMGMNCYFENMRFSILIVLLGLYSPVQAQEWRLLHSRDMGSQITSLAADVSNKIYITLSNGKFVQLESVDAVPQTISVPNRNRIQLINVQNPLTPFLFSRENQEWLVFDRFLSNPVVYQLSQLTGRYIWLMAPSQDQNFWLIQNTPPALIKIDRRTGSLLQESRLPVDSKIEDLVYLEAFKGSVLVVDQGAGVYLFDLFGNELASIKTRGCRYAQLIDNQVITYANDSLFHLSLDQLAVTTIPGPKSYELGLVNGKTYHFVKGSQLDSFLLID